MCLKQSSGSSLPQELLAVRKLLIHVRKIHDQVVLM